MQKWNDESNRISEKSERGGDRKVGGKKSESSHSSWDKRKAERWEEEEEESEEMKKRRLFQLKLNDTKCAEG